MLSGLDLSGPGGARVRGDRRALIVGGAWGCRGSRSVPPALLAAVALDRW